MQAQTDTLLGLPTFDLLVERPSWADSPTEYRTDSIDGSFRATSAGILLDFGVPLKLYGPATLATSTIRGAGASHTAIRWNGLDLNSSLNGTFDLNLAPSFLFDRIQLRSGGESATEGANSMAATLMLQNDPITQNEESPLFGELAYGSFNRQLYQLGYRQELSPLRSRLDIRAVRQTGRNDFPGAGGLRTPNAASELHALSYHVDTRLKSIDDLSLRLENFGWWQQADRQIPPSITQVNDRARQEDRSLRLGSTLSVTGKTYQSRTTLGRTQDQLWFESDVVRRSYSRADRWQLRSDHALRFGQQVFRVEGQLLADRGTTVNIGGQQRRNRYVAHLGYERYFTRQNTWKVEADLRREFVAGEDIPTTWATGLYHERGRQRFGLSAGRNYALPTFNDLYWSDAQARGNPNLLSEDGYNFEFNYRLRPHRWIDELTFTTYRQTIRNRILWLPDRGGVYSPRNQREVASTGVESYIRRSFPVGAARLHTDLTYRYTHTIFRRLSPGDAAVILNKQLPYVPRHTATARFRLVSGPWQAVLDQNFQSVRYTTADNRNSLPAYGVTGLYLGRSMTLPTLSTELHLFVRCDNLLDLRYELIAARPLPGRSFMVGLSFR